MIKEHLNGSLIRTNWKGFRIRKAQQTYLQAYPAFSSSAQYRTIFRFSLVKKDQFQAIISFYDNTGGWPNGFQFFVTAENKLQARTAAVYAGNNYVSNSDITLEVGRVYTLCAFGSTAFYIDDQLAFVAPNLSSGTWGPNGTQRIIIGRDCFDEGNTAKGADLIAHELAIYNTSQAPHLDIFLCRAIAQILYNNGHPLELINLPLSKNGTLIYHTKFDDVTATPALGGLEKTEKGTSIFTLLPSVPYSDYTAKNFISLALNRNLEAADTTPALSLSSELKNYIFEGAQRLITGARTGAIVQFDGNTDLPSTWNNTLTISGNKAGGWIDANHTVISNITRSFVTTLLAANQTPTGKHELNWVSNVNMINLDVQNSKIYRFTVGPAAGLSTLTLDTLALSTNPLQQTFASLMDFTKVITKQFYIQNCSLVTGPMPEAFLEGVLAVNASGSTNLNGKIPEFPASMISWASPLCSIEQFPSSFRNSGTVWLQGNKLSGNCVLVKTSDFNLGAGSASGQTGPGNITIDASANSVNFTVFQFHSSKVTSVILPTTSGRTIGTFLGGNNPNLALISFPSWAMFTGLFSIEGSNQNQVFPFGTVIKGATITVKDNGMSEENVNASFDSWLDNQAAFPAGVKSLNMGGNNAPPTEAGRPGRLALIDEAIESGNWILTASRPAITPDSRSRRIALIEEGNFNGSTNRILVSWGSSSDNPAFATNGTSIATISGTEGVYDGDWTVKGTHFDKNSALAGGFSQGNNYVLLERAGFAFVGNKTGVLKGYY